MQIIKLYNDIKERNKKNINILILHSKAIKYLFYICNIRNLKILLFIYVILEIFFFSEESILHYLKCIYALSVFTLNLLHFS